MKPEPRLGWILLGLTFYFWTSIPVCFNRGPPQGSLFFYFGCCGLGESPAFVDCKLSPTKMPSSSLATPTSPRM